MNQSANLPPSASFRGIILYDGYCVLCNWFVKFVLRIDSEGVIGFARLDSRIARNLHGVIPADVDSVVLVDGHDIVTKSRALFRVFDLVGGPWRIITVFRILPATVADVLYDLIAGNRTRLVGRYETCPTPEVRYRQRFIKE